MDSSQLIGITTLSYLLATLLYLIALLYKRPLPGKIATAFTLIAWLVQSAGILLRWKESYQLGFGHAPLTNMYESVVFFAWTIVLLQLLFEWRYKTRFSGTFSLAFATLALGYASFATELNKSITPLVPALQSNWLITHVVTCFVGYAAFAMAAILGTIYLMAGKKKKSDASFLSARLPELPLLGELLHKTMIFGFIWLSAGIITGSVWANSAWGTYWSWDPKETWSLITWFFYAITLHIHYTRSWSYKRVAWMAIAGFFCVLFTYYGVNYLLSGLHSYGAA